MPNCKINECTLEALTDDENCILHSKKDKNEDLFKREFIKHIQKTWILSDIVFNIPINFAEFPNIIQKQFIIKESTFLCNVSFKNIIFENKVSLYNVNFEDGADFSYAEFKENVELKNVKFIKYKNKSNKATFEKTKFYKDVNFLYTHFDHVKFSETKFKEKVNFLNSGIGKNSYFYGIDFEDDCQFNNTNFYETYYHESKDSFFEKITFKNLRIENCVFHNNIKFGENVVFNGFCNILNSNFNEILDISNKTFSKELSFENSTIEGEFIFIGNKCNKSANFSGVTFKDEAHFSNTHFYKRTYLSANSKKLNFYHTSFDEFVDFIGFDSLKPLNLQEVLFYESKSNGLRFKNVTFGKLSFEDCPILEGDFYIEGKCIFNGEVTIKRCHDFNCNLYIKNSYFDGEVTFEFSDFKKIVFIENNHFNRKTNFKDSKFKGLRATENIFNEFDINSSYFMEGIVFFTKTIFNNKFLFNNKNFMEEVSFEGSTFEESFESSEINFAKEVNFCGATFKKDVLISESTFKEKVNFEDCSFANLISLKKLKFEKELNFKVKLNVLINLVTYYGKINFIDLIFNDKTNFSDVSFNDFNMENIDFLDRINFFKCVFNENTNFSKITFGDSVNFEEAKFIKEVSFSNVIFKSKSNLYNTTFNMETSFTESTFKEKVNFKNTKFPQKEKIDFSGTIFEKDVNFSEKCFNEVKFEQARFEGGADFSNVTFNKDTKFSFCTFKGNTSYFINISANSKEFTFNGSQFLSKIIFANDNFLPDGKPREEIFKNSIVDFSNINLEPSKSLCFRNADLSHCKFLNTDLRETEFTNVLWEFNEKKTVNTRKERTRIYDEISSKTALPYEKLEKLYRDLKINYENRKDFFQAGEFHISEKEMKYQNPNTSFGNKLLLFIYWVSSKYGESVVRPFIWLIVILGLSSVSFIFFESKYSDPNCKSSPTLTIKEEIKIVPVIKNEEINKGKNSKNNENTLQKPLQINNYITDKKITSETNKGGDCKHTLEMNFSDWVIALHYSIRMMLLMKTEIIEPSVNAYFVQTLLTLLSPFFLGLLALAIRQRLKRF
jgi:hypothetical protein